MRSFYNLDEINQYGSGHACQPIGLYVPTWKPLDSLLFSYILENY
jgi:hypothetical protein